MLANKSMDVSDDDVIELKRLPKVINHLLYTHKSEDSTNSNNYINDTGSGGGPVNEAVMYAPHVNKSAKTGSREENATTSDFNRLQTVLNISDNVISDKAYHPAYTLLQARMDSYKEWPATLSQQPTDLAKAGFYYFGIKVVKKIDCQYFFFQFCCYNYSDKWI